MFSAYPIGAVIAFAGNDTGRLGPSWYPCDGRSLPIDDTTRALFQVIGTANGGNGSTFFNLPDYRGRFLRGVDHGAGTDPDAATRLPPGPDGTGNSGDHVGSIQSDATAIPTAGFISKIAHLPDSGQDLAATAVGYTIAKYNGGDKEVETCKEGGDDESRPVNLYLQFYINAG